MITSIFALFIVQILAAVQDHCPRHWTHFKKGRSCYFATSQKLNHYQAQSFCGHLSSKATLLRIESEAENKYLADSTLKGPLWLDAKARFDILDSAAGLFSPGFVLRWPNNRPVRYTNFARGHGFNRFSARNGCVAVTSRGNWLAVNCSTEAYVVCKRKAIPKKPEEGCAKHWHFSRHTKHCYRAIVKENMTMLSADIKCYETGSDVHIDAMLASVSSLEENEFVLRLARQKLPDFEFVMLGAFGESNDPQKWNWLDGTNFSTYQNWDRGMPYGNRSLAVVVMNTRGKWINHYADKILSYYRAVAVCKYKP